MQNYHCYLVPSCVENEVWGEKSFVELHSSTLNSLVGCEKRSLTFIFPAVSLSQGWRHFIFSNSVPVNHFNGSFTAEMKFETDKVQFMNSLSLSLALFFFEFVSFFYFLSVCLSLSFLCYVCLRKFVLLLQWQRKHKETEREREREREMQGCGAGGARIAKAKAKGNSDWPGHFCVCVQDNLDSSTWPRYHLQVEATVPIVQIASPASVAIPLEAMKKSNELLASLPSWFFFFLLLK